MEISSEVETLAKRMARECDFDPEDAWGFFVRDAMKELGVTRGD